MVRHVYPYGTQLENVEHELIKIGEKQIGKQSVKGFEPLGSSLKKREFRAELLRSQLQIMISLTKQFEEEILGNI